MEQQQNLEIEVETKKIIRMLELPLDHVEKAKLFDEAQGIRGEIRILEAQFEEKKQEFKGATGKLQAQFDQIIDKMSATHEVECIQKTFFNNNIVQVWDGDTMIEERPLTAEERQMSFGPPQNGVVMDPETDPEEMTEEERREDIADVIAEERNPLKPSLVN